MNRTGIEKPTIVTLIEQMVTDIWDRVRRCGAIEVDLEELRALKESVKATVRARAVRSFNEAIGSDRELLGSIALTKERAQPLNSKRAVFEARLNNAREQTARMAVPSNAVAGIGLTAVGVFALCFAPTVFSVFFSSMEDAFVAWVISIAIGAAMGGFLTLLLLPSEGESAGTKRTVWLGIGLGVGCGILRIAKADSGPDYLIAIGLTVIECVAVAGLNHFAEKRRKIAYDYRISHAQIVAIEQAIATLDSQLREQQAAYLSQIAELKQRESEEFDVERVAEEAMWAVEAAYRGAINSNRRLLEGGAVEALPMARPFPALGFQEAS